MFPYPAHETSSTYLVRPNYCIGLADSGLNIPANPKFHKYRCAILRSVACYIANIVAINARSAIDISNTAFDGPRTMVPREQE